MIYGLDLQKVPARPGVYLFGRRWGSRFEALYVGKATNIRKRAKDHLNNLHLMQHLANAKAGKRVFLGGVIKLRPGQVREKSLALIERAMIRHFLSEGHDLVNVQGARLRHHELSSSGRHPKRWFPSTMFLEK